MPEDLWDDAVALGRDRGVYPIAHTLGLNYESLKRRIAKAGGRRAPGAPVTSFVELGPSLPIGLTTPGGAVVELTNESGDRLAIHLPGGSDIDVKALATAFFGRRR